jgi:hypothetical protein
MTLRRLAILLAALAIVSVGHIAQPLAQAGLVKVTNSTSGPVDVIAIEGESQK